MLHHILYIYILILLKGCVKCVSSLLQILSLLPVNWKIHELQCTISCFLSYFLQENIYIVWVFFSQIILYVQLERIQQIQVFLQIIFCIFECQGSTKLEKMCILKIKCNKLSLTFQVFCCHQVNFYACNMLSGKVNFLT